MKTLNLKHVINFNNNNNNKKQTKKKKTKKKGAKIKIFFIYKYIVYLFK